MECSNDMDDIFENIEEYNPNKQRKIFIIFDNMITDILSNSKLNPIVSELFIRGRKRNISLAFITEFYFPVPKNIRLNSTHLFIMKIRNKRQLQQTGFNHSSDIGIEDFVNLYKKYTAKPYAFLRFDTTLVPDNPLRFRKNLLEKKKLILTIDEKFRDEKLQYDIYREAAKISTLSSGKIDKCEYPTGEEIIPTEQIRVAEQATKTSTLSSGKIDKYESLTREELKPTDQTKFPYFHSGKAL